MNFENYLNSYAIRLDREVQELLREQLEAAKKTDQKLMPLLYAFVKLCKGGKRIRGTLINLGFEIAGGKSPEIIKIAAAYEIMHTAILIHDDIIDKSATRREEASLHKVLGGGHYGISQALTLADYGFFLSYRIFCQTGFPNDRKIKALNLFSGVMMSTGWGQMLELEKADPYLVMKFKTACYTTSGPLQIGAILGGAGQEFINKLGKFGEYLGIAFQIKDDILDKHVNSPDRAIKKAAEYKNKAMKTLSGLTKNEKLSKLLSQMAEYLIERKK